MEKNNSFHFLSGFILKILGAVFMTLDHVGLFLSDYKKAETIALIFRSFGRLALPIFIFLISEGIRYTRSGKKYLLRLGVLALSLFVGQIFYYFISDKQYAFSSPMTDLFVVGLTLYLLNRKDKYSWFAILPIAFAIFSFVIMNIEYNLHISIKWHPFYLRLDYPLYSSLLGIGFYYSKDISILYLKSNNSTKDLVNTDYQKYTQYTFSALFVLIVSILFYISFVYLKISYGFSAVQAYALFSFIPIALYSGKRGYNKTWFKYACYLYIPMHLILIFLIFLLI